MSIVSQTTHCFIDTALVASKPPQKRWRERTASRGLRQRDLKAFAKSFVEVKDVVKCSRRSSAVWQICPMRIKLKTISPKSLVEVMPHDLSTHSHM